LARDSWWGTKDFTEDLKILQTADLDELRTFGDEEISIEELAIARSSLRTCAKLRGKDPPKLPDQTSPFPFVVRATGKTERDLNEFRYRVNNSDERLRGQLGATAVQSDIELSMKFSATIVSEARDFFGFRLPTKERDSTVRVNIQTFDHPGETFTRAVDLLRSLIGQGALDDFVSERPLPKAIQEEFGLGPKVSTRGINTKRAAQHILHSKSMVYIVDSEALINPNSEANKNVQGGTEKFLVMLSELRENGHKDLEALQIALNRADALLQREATKDNSLVRGTPRSWDSLADNELALSLINKKTSLAPQVLEDDGVAVDTRFVCNFGGLLDSPPDDDIDTKETEKPPYPMLPVNVMESMISVLMNSNLRSKGE
jgi:hypothetical protein